MRRVKMIRQFHNRLTQSLRASIFALPFQTMFFVNAVARKWSRGSHNRKMLMQKLAIILVVAGLLSAGCSRQKKEAADVVKASPSPNLQTRMEQQQKAIQRASTEVQKEQDQKAAAEKSATPSPTPRSE
jgi:apolipoprotein N-acyltransferase